MKHAVGKYVAFAGVIIAPQKLPADFKVDYQRVVRGKGAQGLAEVDDNVCGACGQQITLNMQNELRLARPVFCKSCGCLLYLSE
jgi:predicted  nucleic acid-binding Zn-ribbon protein